MNKETNKEINNSKELKDYADHELIKELTQRIDNFSLDSNFLVLLMVHTGFQYLQYYQEKQKASKQPWNTNH